MSERTVRAVSGREPKGIRIARDVHLNVIVLANRCLDQVEEICQAEGLTHPQYIALWTLCLADDADAGIPMSAVSDGLLNRASDTTRLVDRLERAGLVERLPNPVDRRGVLVRATAEGARRSTPANGRASHATNSASSTVSWPRRCGLHPEDEPGS